jgi:hypothetical protein
MVHGGGADEEIYVEGVRVNVRRIMWIIILKQPSKLKPYCYELKLRIKNKKHR